MTTRRGATGNGTQSAPTYLMRHLERNTGAVYSGHHILRAERRQRESTQTAPENFAIKQSAYWQKRGCT